jgi:hypothetical protein
MVATALVLMADRMRSPLVTISTAVIINREIGVSALREWMVRKHRLHRFDCRGGMMA